MEKRRRSEAEPPLSLWLLAQPSSWKPMGGKGQQRAPSGSGGDTASGQLCPGNSEHRKAISRADVAERLREV